MFEKLQTGEKIHDAPRQPQTCSHPIYARMLTGYNLKIITTGQDDMLRRFQMLHGLQ